MGAVRNRVELAGIELREEKHRAVELFWLTAAGVFFAGVAVMTLTVAIALLISASARPYFLLGMGILYAVGAVTAVLQLRHKLKNGQPPLAETIEQLRKDGEWLSSPKKK